MSSIRKPKRITIRGDDEKEYKFLVKGGEDLRLNQSKLSRFELHMLCHAADWVNASVP